MLLVSIATVPVSLDYCCKFPQHSNMPILQTLHTFIPEWPEFGNVLPAGRYKQQSTETFQNPIMTEFIFGFPDSHYMGVSENRGP